MVYLLHFERPYRHTAHYIGYAETPATFERRVAHHRAGTGAKLLKKLADAGIDFEVAQVWDDGDKAFERKLKNWHGAGKFCPLCRKNLHHRQNLQFHLFKNGNKRPAP